MEEEKETSQENDTSREVENPEPEIQNSQESFSAAPSSGHRKEASPASYEPLKTLSATSSSSLLSPASLSATASHHRVDRRSQDFQHSSTGISVSAPEDEDLLPPILEPSLQSDSLHDQQGSRRSSAASSPRYPLPSSIDSESPELLSLSSQHSYGTGEYAIETSVSLSQEVDADLSGETDQGTPCLLPETSGFFSSARRGTTELKRGRGRPRKEGQNSLSQGHSSRGLGRPIGRPFGSRGLGRGLGKNLGRGAGRGSRGGRRGRPPYPHAGLSLVTSPPVTPERDSPSQLLSPTEIVPVGTPLVVKPDVLPPSGMADYTKQSTTPTSSSAADGGGSAPTSTSASPVQGMSASNPSNPVSDPATTPDSQSAGHLCALCNCGERSLLGQGETWRFEPSPGFDVFKLPEPKTLREADDVENVGKNQGPQPTTWRRSRGPLKSGRERSRSPRQSGEEDSSGCHISDELALVGFQDDTDLSQLFEPTGHVWVHQSCALWSEGVTLGETNQLEDVDRAVYNAMSNRCFHCRKYGATVICCIPECGKKFHFPCASAGGCFQDMKTLSLLCPDHIDQAETIAGNAACCIQCGTVGSVKEQLFCTSCGHHYHGNCLCPPVDMKPIVRAGWQCPNCKICQTCRTASDDSKMLVCDKCDKGYHTFCLKPAMTTIPKNGWKCKNCRICTDCGSRTPGSGPSSRWHLNYSVCDSCYQQRNKGLCCPLCGKAYRHFHNKTMLPCMLCKKFVHIECDPTINPNIMSKLKELPQDYICTVCRETDPDAMMELDQQLPTLQHALSEESMESYLTDDVVSKDDPMLTEAALSGPSGISGGATGGLTASSSQESLFVGDDSSSSFDLETTPERVMMSPGSRRDSFEFSKKGRQKSKHSSSERHHHSYHHHHQQQSQPQQQAPQQQHQQQQPQQPSHLQSLSEKRRAPKIKVKIGGQVMGIASVEGSSPISHHSSNQTPFSIGSPDYSTQSVDGLVEEKEKEKEKEKDKDKDDDDDGDDHPSTLILAESADNFIMDQDICKACGSFGKDEESKMIVCTQCGQCYHPYCVTVTVTKVMLQKGWRCLDCTVCEGCGGPYDEGRLLLCDDCDISYHTYCLDPPLQTVPKGNWKCKWCVMCVNCGSTSPGYSCQWMNNYTQCGPCHSKMYCPVCLDSYLIDQLIIQCQQCDRWLHCECDGLTCEDEAEIAADYGYHCLYCRPKTGKDGPLPPPPPPPSPPKEERVPTPPPPIPYMPPVPEPPRQFYVDGVYLFQTGLNQIQRLQVTNPKKFKQQQQVQRRMSQLEDSEESCSLPVPAAGTAGTSGAGGGEGMETGTQEEVGEDGVKKRKPRRVFGLGVGGFIVRQRSRQWLAKRQASYEEQEDPEKTGEQAGEKEKPKRRRKIKKSKLEEAFPFYMQEAFFGKSILEQTKEKTTKGLLKTDSDSDQEVASPTKMMPASDVAGIKTLGSGSDLDSTVGPAPAAGALPRPHTSMSGSEQGEDIHSLDESELKDILHEFQENDDIFSIINEELKDDGLSLDSMEAVTSKDTVPSKTSELPDNLANMLTSDMDKDLDVDHMISEGLVHFDSKTVEDIFSGVLSDSQPNQTSDPSTSTGQFINQSMSMPPSAPGTSGGPAAHPGPHPGMAQAQGQMMRRPMGAPPVSGSPGLPPFGVGYSPTYGPQMGPNFPQGMGPGPQPGPSGSVPPWGMMEDDAGDSNKRTILKWEQEEEMGDQATISCVLYVNMCHPDLKQKHPDWSERSKQIAKLWRKLTPDEKAPYLSKARKNRTSNRVKNAQKKKAGQKSKNQVSQELQRRQEIQKQQDSEAMPPPPAPPPLPGGEHFHEGGTAMMSNHPGASPYPRHSWQEDSPGMKQPGTPATPDHPGPQGDQVFSPPGSAPGSSVNSPDPYAFDSFSPTQIRPGIRPQHRLPGLQAFGASSPREDEGLFTAPGMGPRVRPSSDMFAQGPSTPGPEMFMGGPRRPQGPGPRMGVPGQADASTPLGDSNQPRASGDPYAFPPSTPQTPVQGEDPFLPPGPPTPDAFHPGRPRGDMFQGGSPQMRPPMTPTSMGPGQASPFPGSPVRMPDPSFRHPLARSNSLPDPYSMPIGTPRPQMDPGMSRSMSDVSPEAVQMYRGARMPLQHPEEGGENQGNIHHQQLRVILGQQTKQRMAKKQEEAERMMQGPSTGWQTPEGPEGMEGYPPRPPFRGPSPQGFMRGPHPGMGPQGARPPFYPGPGGMQRPPHSEAFSGPPPEGILPDQRAQFIQMMQERNSQSFSAPTTPSGPVPTSQHVVPPFIPQGGESDMVRQQQHQQQPQLPQQQPAQHQQPVGASGPAVSTGESHAGLTRQISATQQGGEDEIFTGTEGTPASTSKAPGSEDGAAVESDTLLEGISAKAAKPSLSSEEDKNEDDDLLSADGTFDILKYADPDLDLDLDDKMFEHLDFMEEQGQGGDQKKTDEEKSDDSKEEVKEEKDSGASTSRAAAAADFQAQFLEFNQRQKTEAQKEKEEEGIKTEDDKEKEKSEVGQIAAMLQGTEAMGARLTGSEPGTPDVKPLGADSGMGAGMPRAPFNPNMASPHMQMSPSQGPNQPCSSGLPSPKIMHSPRSGQPSPRTPGIQSPYNTLIGGRHSASPHSQPMTPGGPQLSPFSAGSVQIPFSPPTSTGAQQGYGQGTGSAPHSPYPTSSQPPFASLSSPGPTPHMMSPGYPAGGMGPRAPAGFNQMGHPGGPRGGPMYGQPPHGVRPVEAQAGRFPRPGMDAGMEGVEGLGPRMPQPMTLPDGRPHPMFQQMQARGMRGPPPPTSTHPSLQQQLTHVQTRHPYPGPGQPPRLSHPPQVRGVGPRQPGPPFPGAPPGGVPQSQAAQREQHTLLDELLEQEKEEQKRQAEQQAMMHRREGGGAPGEQGMPVMSSGPPPVSVAPPPHTVGVMPMHSMRMPGPEGSGPGWTPVSEGMVSGPPPGQFQQGFAPRLMHPGMAQRPPVPFSGPPQGPGTSGAGPTPGQAPPMGPPTPVNPPSGEPGPEYERQAVLYEEWLRNQAMYLEAQVKTFEGQVNKLKRSKKTIQARQRLAKKNNQELNPADTAELERITTEQSGLQKQLEAQRKLLRQHQHLLQEYKTKQQEQFGRMWTGGMAETPMPGSTMPMPHPRTPGHNSVRLSPTARQEYEAYMSNRIRQANQMQQQNRMRPPTTILGDNNPFSEAFQQREQMQRVTQTPGTPGGPPPQLPPPGQGPQGPPPPRPPFSMGGPGPGPSPEQIITSAGSTMAPTSGPASTTNAAVATSIAATVVSTSAAPPHSLAGPQPTSTSGPSVMTSGPSVMTSGPPGQAMSQGQPMGQGPTMTIGGQGPPITVGPQGQPMTAGPQGQPMTTVHPGTPGAGPRGPVEGMGAMQFFRERNLPFEGGAGPRFPRPPGPGGFQDGSAPGQGPNPRLPPYPGPHGMFPQGAGPGMEQARMAFQPGMGPYPPGMTLPSSQMSEMPPTTQAVPKEKKKRKKKKKADELEGAQSQPLPPSLPSQAMLGQMSSQSSSATSTSTALPTTKPAELPRPQSETERRILEILNNSQKELQNPTSPSSARGGKSPRSRSPARAQPVVTSEDKLPTGTSAGAASASSAAAPAAGVQATGLPSDSQLMSQAGGVSGISDTSGPGMIDRKNRIGDGKNTQAGGYPTTVTSVSETQSSSGIPGTMPPQPPPHIQQRMPMHPQQHSGPLPPGFQSQQHMQHLQNLARMQQFQQQQQQFAGMPETQRHAIDGQQMPMGGPRYPQLHPFSQRQRFPPAAGQPPHPFHGRPPHIRGGHPQYTPGMQASGIPGIPSRMPQDPRMMGPDPSMMPPHSMMAQHMPASTAGMPPHLTHRPPVSMQQGQALPSGPLSQPGQAPPLSHMPPASTVNQYQGQGPPPGHGMPPHALPASTVAASVPSTNDASSALPSSSPAANLAAASTGTDSTPQSSAAAAASVQPAPSSSSQGTPPTAAAPPSSAPSASSNIPAEVTSQSQTTSAHTSTAATTSTTITTSTTTIPSSGVDSTESTTTSAVDSEEKSKKVCDDGVHCGTDDEDDAKSGAKKVCDDGIHCGTDDEDDAKSGAKKICDDGIHCGTDDEDDSSAGVKKVCDDGIHCGTDDEEDVKLKSHAKKVCEDGMHCGTDDEDDANAGAKKLCDDGIHCGTDDEDDTSAGAKKVCEDGIHCGTDDEDDAKSEANKVCSDGIHCGTDDEDNEKSMKGDKKKVCDDGIHCGTDDEEEGPPKFRSKKVCDDGIHCGTDDEDDTNAGAKKVCEDGIHCGTDDEDEGQKKTHPKRVCEDGIHCGTDDEDEPNLPSGSKKVCRDGIHCGTDDEGEDAMKSKVKKICDDGIHCGTDDEDDDRAVKDCKKKVCNDGLHCGTDDEEENAIDSKINKVCDDGIHCGTDDEDGDKTVKTVKKKVCDDGLHCGTDDEDENAMDAREKKVCDDGVHCGTDDEDDDKTVKDSKKKLCDDGLHCGTDDEDDNSQAELGAKKACSDGVHCGTDDEDDGKVQKASKKVCSDGIHCGTDDEDDSAVTSDSKKVCEDGIHCGTDDEDDGQAQKTSKKICSDGIHCGSDDEDDSAVTSDPKKICEDGIHCGTDDEDEGKVKSASKKVCSDGIHCGTDDEDENNAQPSESASSSSPPPPTSSSTTSTLTSIAPAMSSTTTTVPIAPIQGNSVTENAVSTKPDIGQQSSESQRVETSMEMDSEESAQPNTQTSSSSSSTVTASNNSEELSASQAQPGSTCQAAVSVNSQAVSSSAANSETEMNVSNISAPVTAPLAGAAIPAMTTSAPRSVPISIDSQISSQLAAVSRSLANFKPCIDSNASEPSANAVRPSDTLSAFSFATSSSTSSSSLSSSTSSSTAATSISTVSATASAQNELTESEPKSETPPTSQSSVSEKSKLSITSVATDNRQEDTEVDQPSNSTKAEQEGCGVVAGTESESEQTAPSGITSSSASETNDSSSVTAIMPKQPPPPVAEPTKTTAEPTKTTAELTKTTVEPTKPAVKTLPPLSFPSSSHSSALSTTTNVVQDTITSASLQAPSASSASASAMETSSSELVSSSQSSTAPSQSPLTTSSSFQSVPLPLLSVQSAPSPTPSLPPPPPPALSLPSQMSKPWTVTPSQVTTASIFTTTTTTTTTAAETSNNATLTNMNNTISSASRSTPESRPVIPPLRIRRDGQSQPQVYESTASRDYHRTSGSEFSMAGIRGKAEGDLKLVLRKSSDGTAELISGPSFKAKRAAPVTDGDASTPSSRVEPEQRLNLPTSSVAQTFHSVTPSTTVGSSQPPIINTAEKMPVSAQSVPSMGITQPPYNVKTLDLNPPSSAAFHHPSSVSGAHHPISTPVTSHLPNSSSPVATLGPAPSHQVTPPPTPVSTSTTASPVATSLPSSTPASSTPNTPSTERTEPFSTRPGSGLFKNVTYTKSPDTDVVKINVDCTKTSKEGTKKVVRSYTTDIQALERLQSTIDAVASGESSFEPEINSEPPSRPGSQDSRSTATPVSTVESCVSSAASVAPTTMDGAGFPGAPRYSSPTGQMGMGHSPQQQMLHQHQMIRGMGQQQQQQQQRPQMPQQQQQQQNNSYMPQSQSGFSPHQPPFHPRMTRPPLDLLAQVSQSALSSAGTAIPTSTHPGSQEHSQYMTERSPSGSAEHSPLHTSPHQSYPGMMGPRPMGSSPGVSPKAAPGQTSQAYMPGSGPAQQQFMAGTRFPQRMHHDMSAAPPYGMAAHPMSPTGMHRQRPPHFGMGGDMSRMPRPPRGMPPHPQHRPIPPEMMGPEHGMRPRMPHQFMSPSHPGMAEMPPTSHGMPMTSHAMTPPHGMPQSPHGLQTSPHGMPSSPHGMQQTSPHGMQRPPMMSPHHPMMQGPQVSYPQTSMSGGGGPLASLANFHPPGHPGVNTTMGSPMPRPHQRPPMFPQMMGEARMAAQLRMMANSGEGPGPHMGPHFRHMMMRGMTPPGSQPSSQMSSPQMSPHMSPQMSPGMQTQPLRHLDNIPDEKGFITSLPSSSGMGLPGMAGDASMAMGGQPKSQRQFGPGMLPGDPSGFMAGQPLPHMQSTSDSGSVVSTPGLTSPMSDTAPSVTGQVKLEPSEDSASADGSITRDDLDLDQKATHNELLKQLLGTGQGGRQLPTPDSTDSPPKFELQKSEDSLPSLTPEQQRQLEMIDSMPLCKEKEISTPEWDSKTPEEKEKINEMRRQEYEQKRQAYEVNRKNKKKTIGGAAAPIEKKKRKSKGAEQGVEIPRKRSKKSKLKENQLKELEAQAETFLQQLHNMPPIQLQEPIIATSMSILPLKGAANLTGVTTLRGRYCSAYVDGIEDMYGSLLFPQPPPGLRPTVPSAEVLAQRQLANEAKLRMMQDPLQMLKVKDGGPAGSRPGPRTSPRLILPPQPRIEIKSEQLRRDERETPDTIVSSSSPEFGFNEQEPEYPGLRPIDPAVSNLAPPEESTSPVVPLVQPLPVKPASSSMDQQASDIEVKQELGLVKQDSHDLDLGLAGPSSMIVDQPGRDLTVNLPNLTSGLAQPFLDPALDQQVSVTLTLSTGAAQDIGAVISAIADLLKIAVPPTYEITRSPSPEMFRMSLTHKEEAVNIHTLMSTRPRFCQHCDVFVLCSGIAKYKREFPILLEEDPDCGDEEMIFCSMNCSMQFSAGLEARQRQAQLRLKELESTPSTSQTPPPCSVTVKTETPSYSASSVPNSATVAANVDEIIAAVAADTSLSPREPDTPGDMSASPGTPSTTPTSPLPTTSPAALKAAKRHRRSSSQISEPAYLKPLVKKWRGLRWKRGNQDLLDSITKIPPTPTYELDKLWKSLGMIHRPKPDVEDKRKCVFCQATGDGESDGASRLLNMDVNKWVHLNCALWSYDVYETLNGALMNVELAYQRSASSECVVCRKIGATLACFKPRCANAYHLPCARLRGCMFYQDKTLLCPTHIPKVPLGNELTSLVVLRRVYVNRDEDRQVASMIHQEEGHCSLRIGSLVLHSIGQLLPHQILCGKFNSKECIYPVGFRTSRFYWSYYSLYKRCRYICSIHDNEGEPEFRIQVVDSGHEDLIFKDSSPFDVWMHILKPLERMRREADLVKMFPTFMAAEELFGLTESSVVKVLESLPGTDLLHDYNFKFGRSPLIEMPPAINPTGCARTEPKLRTHFRRPHTLQSTNSRSLPSTVTGVSGDMNSPYLKQFVHSKSQQYRKLKTDWKTLVYLGRSRIQGLGLYAARDLEKHTMVIEYIGDLIRNEVANRREKEYEAQNRGVYMFRIDNDVVIDATMAGGPARYINHSCNPNCVAEVVDIEKESKIIIITSRKIAKGEELTYDYKFDFEDDQHKIPCMCGATNCRKWMN